MNEDQFDRVAPSSMPPPSSSVAPELRAVRAGLVQFAREVRVQPTTTPITPGDARRLISAMAFAVRACYAASESGPVRRFVGQRDAAEQYARLALVCTQDRHSAIVSILAAIGEPEPEFEADAATAVTRCYEVTRPVLQAAARLVQRIDG